MNEQTPFLIIGNELDSDGWALIAPYGEWPKSRVAKVNGVPTEQKFLQILDNDSADKLMDKENSMFSRLKRALVGISVWKGHPDLPDHAPETLGKADEAVYAVSPETAAKIKAATGRDVTGHKHLFHRDAMIHIHRQHGAGKEDQAGHEPVTKDDLEKIPDIVGHPDSVVDGGKNNRGVQTVKYSKRYNGTTYYVEEEWPREKVMAATTMYKHKAPVGDAVSSPFHTSKTTGAKKS